MATAPSAAKAAKARAADDAASIGSNSIWTRAAAPTVAQMEGVATPAARTAAEAAEAAVATTAEAAAEEEVQPAAWQAAWQAAVRWPWRWHCSTCHS